MGNSSEFGDSLDSHETYYIGESDYSDDVDGSDEEHCTPDNLSMEDRLTNTIEITKRMSDALE